MTMNSLRFGQALLTMSLIVTLLLTSLAPSSAIAEEEDGGPTTVDRTFDAIVLRPLGAMGVVLGAALMLPAALFTAPGGEESLDNAYDVFVRTPLDELINAPLGRDFGS